MLRYSAGELAGWFFTGVVLMLLLEFLGGAWCGQQLSYPLMRRFADRIIDFLEDWGLDGLREHTVVRHLFTPEDFASELNAIHGNAFGIEPRLTQTAYLRPHNASEDVSNLYLVGAGTHPGAGIPGVTLGAEATAFCVARDLNLPTHNLNERVRESATA
ncbi:MAG TPA: hypothetical protein VMO47_13055 [Rhodothermales bacterium]|nr:hypothetical protein [Rhodothermales bacterium]